MNAPSRIQICLLLAAAVLLSTSAFGKNNADLTVPDGVLLLGNPGNSTLALSTQGSASRIAPLGPDRDGHITYPSLSRDGKWVATSYVKGLLPVRREGIAVYSVAAQRWAMYGDHERILGVSLSPDASMVAFRSGSKLMLFNLRSAQTSVLDEAFQGGQTSWSHDGKNLVYAVASPGADQKNVRYEIYVMNVEDRSKKRLGEGSDPSWSPSGEWIAYLSSNGDCSIVRPDGSGASVIVPKRGKFVYPPVWSPDSKKVLVNEDAGKGKGNVHVHLYDFEAKSAQKLAENSGAALGWAAR